MRILTMKTLVAMGFLALAGCATDLVVKEFDREVPKEGQKDAPISNARGPKDGVVVNQRATYQCTATTSIPGYLEKKEKDGKPKETKLVGIEHDKVLVINVWRAMFASGKLTIKLDEKEVIKEAGITSQTGATATIKTADSALKTRNEILKQQKDKD